MSEKVKGEEERTAQSAVQPYSHALPSWTVPASLAAPFHGPYSGTARRTPERPQ